MAHELELDRDGRASFCYNNKNGNPWHQLGEPFDAGFTLQQGLIAARVRHAEKAPLWAMTPQGMAEVATHQAIVWPSIDEPGQMDVLGVTGNQYQLVQYSDVAELAMAVVGAASDVAALDTMGLLFGGKRFFGFIDFGDLDLVLPSGITDKTFRGLGFMSSHDGSQAITFYTTNVRAVCNNTVTAGLANSKSVVRIRHTAKADERMGQVRSILGLAYGGDAEFTSMVAKLDQIVGGYGLLERAINKVWAKPVGEDATDRAITVWKNRKDKIMDLYASESNAGGFGHTGWSAYNTISEYLDHHYGKDATRRAIGAIDPSSSQSARKTMLAASLLAGV